jgi:hypothetical protein
MAKNTDEQKKRNRQSAKESRDRLNEKCCLLREENALLSIIKAYLQIDLMCLDMGNREKKEELENKEKELEALKSRINHEAKTSSSANN